MESLDINLESLKNRFMKLTDIVNVHINHRGYIPEITAYAPFKGLITIRNAINFLQKGILIDFEDGDLEKIRNSLIYYNEIHCKKYSECKPAYKAFEEVDRVYVRKFYKDMEGDTIFPYQDVLKGIFYFGEEEESQIGDSMLQKYLKNRKKIDVNESKPKEPIKTTHEENCEIVLRGDDFSITKFPDYEADKDLDIEYHE